MFTLEHNNDCRMGETAARNIHNVFFSVCIRLDREYGQNPVNADPEVQALICETFFKADLV